MSSSETPGGGGNGASNRRFCRRCSTVISVDLSAGVFHFCPVCKGELTEPSDRPSSSSITSSRPANPAAAPLVPVFPVGRITLPRRATFEHRHPSENFVYVVSGSDFFSSPYPNSMPLITPLPSAGSVLSFRFIRRYIEHCVNEGASINSNLLQNQILLLFENYSILNRPLSAPLSAIAALPDIEITEEIVASNRAVCSVCIENFKTGEEAKRLPCDHLYHRNCIVRWLNQNNSCPVCRSELRLHDPITERLRAAWSPHRPFSSEEMAGSGEQSTVLQRRPTSRFQIELQWPVKSRYARFEIDRSTVGEGSGGGGEGNGGDPSDNEASGSGEQESGLH